MGAAGSTPEGQPSLPPQPSAADQAPEPKQAAPEAKGASESKGSLPASERPMKRVLAGEVHDRLTIFVVRALFFFIAGGIGLYCTRLFDTDPFLSPLFSCGIAFIVILAEVFFSKAPIRTISAITFGLFMGLILSTVFQPVIELMVESISPTPPTSMTAADRQIYQQTLQHLVQFLQLTSTTLFCYFGVTVLLQTKDDFKFIIPYVEFRKEVKGRAPLIVDTSAIIDGRICALLATGVLDQRLSIPKFVFDELQAVADSPDRSRRERGRRGMDILGQLCREYGAEVVEKALSSGAEVDAALLDLVTEVGGKLLTTDYNLQKRAKLHGITVINVNDLATALKPAIVPGEGLRVKLLRAGEDLGQAVGFLADGTMVVVENASRKIGQEVSIEVTSAIQTSAGKMVFGRLGRGPGGREGGRDGERRDRRPEGNRRPPP
jgi:uncharacterized protein YacL